MIDAAPRPDTAIVMAFLTDLSLLALAVTSVLDAWFKGSVFADRRARLEAWREAPGWRGFASDLLCCRFCLSYHAALLGAGALLAPAWLVDAWVGPPWGALTRLPLAALAVAYAAHRLDPATADFLADDRAPLPPEESEDARG